MQIHPVPQQRIIEKMDEYMGRRDYAGAERHLLYWLEEALQGNDLRGQLMLRNELIGHFRKTRNREEALRNVDEALRLLEVLDFDNSVSAGTTYVNAGTACNAFGEFRRAEDLFEKARGIYEENSSPEPQFLGGLYNNMALNCVSVAKAMKKEEEAGGKPEAAVENDGKKESREWFGRAFELYGKALEQMRKVPNGELEQAVTYLNMTDALEGRDGPEAAEKEINACLDTAYELLKTPSVLRDGYYAFVCEKCAPAFSYHGYFLAAEELKNLSAEIYKARQEDSRG